MTVIYLERSIQLLYNSFQNFAQHEDSQEFPNVITQSSQLNSKSAIKIWKICSNEKIHTNPITLRVKKATLSTKPLVLNDY